MGYGYNLALARMLHQRMLTYAQFLTANLTPLLMLYLQELHAHGLANAEHTTPCSPIPTPRWEMSPKWMCLFAAREELLGLSRSMEKQSPGKERAENLRLILTRRFVYVDKRGSLTRLHTLPRGGGDTRII